MSLLMSGSQIFKCSLNAYFVVFLWKFPKENISSACLIVIGLPKEAI